MKHIMLKRENGGLIFIAVTVALCVIAMLGVFAVLIYFYMEGRVDGLSSEKLCHSMNLLSLIVLGIGLAVCAAGWLLHFECEGGTGDGGGAESSLQARVEKSLDWGACFFDLFMMMTFLFAGIRFSVYSDSAEKTPIWMTALLIILFAAMWFSKQQLKKIEKKIKPDKRQGIINDEAARDRKFAYRSGYRTYRKTTRVLLVGMLLLMVLIQFTSVVAIALFLQAGVIWMIMGGLFRYENYMLRKKAARKEERNKDPMSLLTKQK